MPNDAPFRVVVLALAMCASALAALPALAGSPALSDLARAAPLPAGLESAPADVPDKTDPSAWRHEITRDGVTVHVRTLPGSSIHAFHGLGRIEAPPAVVLAVLRDVASYPALMPPTEAAELLRDDGGDLHYHMVIHPSFISRRDYCIRVHLGQQPGGRLTSEWMSEAAGCPAPPAGVVRLPENRGRWLLVPDSGGRATLVSYMAHTELGGSIPAWIVNRAGARAVPDIFRSVQKAALLPKYQAAAASAAAAAAANP